MTHDELVQLNKLEARLEALRKINQELIGPRTEIELRVPCMHWSIQNDKEFLSAFSTFIYGELQKAEQQFNEA